MKKLYYLYEYLNNPNIRHWKSYRCLDVLDPIYLVLTPEYKIMMRRYASYVCSFSHVIYELMEKINMSCQVSNVFLEISDQNEEKYLARFKKKLSDNYYDCVEFLQGQPTDPRMENMYADKDVLETFNGYPASIFINLLISINKKYSKEEIKNLEKHLLQLNNEHENDFGEVSSFDDPLNIGKE